jgi:hypothetical protein
MPLPPDLSKLAFSLFPQMADRVMCGQCVTCDSTLLRGVDFRDDLSRKEYGISGMCQKCQDVAYGVEPNWNTVEDMFEG